MSSASSRREFVRNMAGGAAALTLPGWARAAETLGGAAGAARPNIVVIMADDLGFSDLGCFGGEIPTPNLDRMAAAGVRFTQFYNTAKCEPSRRSLLSGLWHPEFRYGASRNYATIAEVLRSAGYRTLMAGKWHMDGTPLERGFDRYFGHLSGATDYFLGDDTFLLDDRPFKVPAEGFYTTDANTDHAMRFLDEARGAGKPFFLYLAYNAPHYPLQAPKADIDRHRGRYLVGWDELRRRRHARQKEIGLLDPSWALSPRPDDVRAWDALAAEEREREDLTMAVYAAMVERLDRNLGRLLDKLRENGAEENTVVMFFSDNGGCPFQRSKRTEIPPWQGGGHLTYHAAWAGASNTPFRWYKQNNHEGGIASPFIVRWPAALREGGRVEPAPAHLVDILPTCLDLAGASFSPPDAVPNALPPRGVSIVPAFHGRALPERTLYWIYGKNRAVRTGDWKLVSAVGGPWELYDMARDRTELHDLSAEQPDRARELAARWQEWSDAAGRMAGRTD